MNLVERLKQWLEYLGGAADLPPRPLDGLLHSILTGVWWLILAVAITLFCGQSSKFIYIDF